MSVNHCLLPVTEEELALLLETPEQIREFVEARQADVCSLLTDGCAIVAITAEGDDDPLAFIRTGTSSGDGGWVGTDDGDECPPEIEMGYGPASYYRHPFVTLVARKLDAWTPDLFAANCDMEGLEAGHCYPSGWLEPTRKDYLIDSFGRYRACILEAAATGRHLLVWCE